MKLDKGMSITRLTKVLDAITTDSVSASAQDGGSNGLTILELGHSFREANNVFTGGYFPPSGVKGADLVADYEKSQSDIHGHCQVGRPEDGTLRTLCLRGLRATVRFVRVRVLHLCPPARPLARECA